MGNLVIASLAAFIALIAAAFSTLLAEEFKAWRPTMVKRLIAVASSLLPEADRERYVEEWSAYLEEIPGELSKVLTALGFVWAAARESEERPVVMGAKRVMDVIGACGAAVFMLPIMLIAVVALALEGTAMPVATAERIGKDGKRFRMYRFQTSGGVAGRFIKWTSFHHIPALLNVIKGDMSLVGPMSFPASVDRSGLEEADKLLLKMRPGLTGVSQLMALSNRDRDLPDILVADMFYVAKHSLSLDVGILLKTFITSVRASDGDATFPTAGVSAFILLIMAFAPGIAILAFAYLR